VSDLFGSALAERLARLGDESAEAYRTAHPFPHIVIDDFLPAEPVERALAAFPSPDDLDWQRFRNPNERKLAYAVAERMPAAIREVLYFLNAPPVLDFLERMTGIPALIPDPYFTGGGLHQIEPGGHLGVHADFNAYERLQLDRRLNLLLYLNHDWEEAWGGHLELWDERMSHCEKRVLPVFNRCVVFSTTDTSYHGHPVPLGCPPGRFRRSLATYYYTNGRPEAERSDPHSTLFQARPDDPLALRGARAARRVAGALAPPILVDTWRRLRAKGPGRRPG
jgi:hypothetical protein